MPHLVFSAGAKRDLKEIFRYVSDRSGNVPVARRFAQLLRTRCQQLASLPGVLGQARPELGPELRSYPFRNYTIVFRYGGGRFEIINILERHRDIKAYFADWSE